MSFSVRPWSRQWHNFWLSKPFGLDIADLAKRESVSEQSRHSGTESKQFEFRTIGTESTRKITHFVFKIYGENTVKNTSHENNLFSTTLVTWYNNDFVACLECLEPTYYSFIKIKNLTFWYIKTIQDQFWRAKPKNNHDNSSKAQV